MAIHFIWINIEWCWLSVEEGAKFGPQFFLQIIQSTFIENRAHDAALVKRRRYCDFSRQKVVETLANCRLNFGGFEILLLLTRHSQCAGSNTFYRFGRVTIDPQHKVWNHRSSVHFCDLFNPKIANNTLVDE